MQLLEVVDKRTKKQFHQVPNIIYKNDPNWAAPLQGMVEGIFDPKKNKTFRNGKAIRWVLVDDNDNLIGRIAAFINFNLAKTYEQPTGGCGFFECIDDQEAANLLFKAAADWNTENGMEAMDGPINFGENYVNWGLLVDGFMPQGFGMPYNPKYYEKLFREFGFEVYFEQYSFHLDYTVPFPERFWKIAGWVAKKPQYQFKHFDFKQAHKFVKDFCTVYDAAWSFHEHYKPLDPDDLHDFLTESKAILDPEMIWYAYADGRPIAVFVMIPDINQLLIKLNGKLNLPGILKFFYYKKKKVINRTRIFLMGVDPKFQRAGIESGIFWHQEQIMKKKSHQHYKEVELSWAGDFNPKIIAIYEATGAKKAKTHYTMRYMFDRSKKVTKAPSIS
ncbi:GNAT family N-acetyltransferase [Draconibacterium halophilum]|uniref:GNAT family N-acetyltransferase n=1 Tax=Draconibacterium halophilum TaxID=2706887 RepID=A0A6C0R921_9BACT|nr:GNAT family N-acetyltransferase [Draconibacterium halophilum]QIA06988.1 GNAT family N-acetyltransferase [Draconibacterium halophilum]